MRKLFLVKMSLNPRTPPWLCRSALLFILYMILCTTSMSSLAAHQRQPPIPSPLPVLMHESDANSATGLSSTPTLLALTALFGVRVYLLKKKSAQIQADLEKEIEFLKHRYDSESSRSTEYRNIIASLHERAAEVNEALTNQELELTTTQREVTHLKTCIRHMIEADPSIEAKARDLIRIRTQAEADQKARIERDVEQKHIQAQGQARVHEFLTQMRTRY